MNELFEAGDAPKRIPTIEPAAVEVDYDDELDTAEPGYRYVVKRPSAGERRRPARGTRSPER